MYRTRCEKCGSDHAHVKYFLWVKTHGCTHCNHTFDLFPGYLLSEDSRHPYNVIVCRSCGSLNEREDEKKPGSCSTCTMPLFVKGPAFRNRCECPHCHTLNKYPAPEKGAPRHRMFAIEYHCPTCKPTHTGRFFKKPDPDDLSKLAEAESQLKKLRPKFVPDDEIPEGDETDRLHRWGYRRYHEMFNTRQLMGLELSCRLIAEQKNETVRHALSTNLSDLLRYQNMLCRYDTMSLKSLDIFSVHGFPVGLIQCESNLLGISSGPAGASVGSGGWSNIVDKFEKAKAYCDQPFEVRHENGRKKKVPVPGEWIGDNRKNARPRTVEILCGDASKADLKPNSIDAVLTDPPYYGSVQYAELMDFCYVWLRRLVPPGDAAFQAVTTRHISELTENENMERGLEAFAEGLSAVFFRMATALKDGRPLAFTYHHNKLEAYVPVAIAILDSGLTCSAAIPCPAEMEASIHINGTGSSILDTVFVCRSKLTRDSQTIPESPEDLAAAVAADVRQLAEAGVEASAGDIRCLTFGHMIRSAVVKLRDTWDRNKPTVGKVIAVRHCLSSLGLDAVNAGPAGGRTARVKVKG